MLHEHRRSQSVFRNEKGRGASDPANGQGIVPVSMREARLAPRTLAAEGPPSKGEKIAL